MVSEVDHHLHKVIEVNLVLVMMGLCISVYLTKVVDVVKPRIFVKLVGTQNIQVFFSQVILELLRVFKSKIVTKKSKFYNTAHRGAFYDVSHSSL